MKLLMADSTVAMGPVKTLNVNLFEKNTSLRIKFLDIIRHVNPMRAGDVIRSPKVVNVRVDV